MNISTSAFEKKQPGLILGRILVVYDFERNCMKTAENGVN